MTSDMRGAFLYPIITLFLFIFVVYQWSGVGTIGSQPGEVQRLPILPTTFFDFTEFKHTRLPAARIPIKKVNDTSKIIILIVVEEQTDMTQYHRAISTVDCYRRIYGYSFEIISDKDYQHICKQKDKFFRRHCITAKILEDYEYLLFIDADTGVVNPKRRIEEFMDERFDVVLYDRFHDPEVAAGSYIVRNTEFAKKFLNDFADYESKLIEGTFHGTDNGALHAYLVEITIGNSSTSYDYCIQMWHAARNLTDLFAYEYCMRNLLGQHDHFGKIKITNRFSTWMRDSWLTNSLWSPETDFLLHGWKSHQYKNYTEKDLPINITFKQSDKNIYPLASEIQVERCTAGNTTWNYDRNLIVSGEEIMIEFKRMERIVLENHFAVITTIPRTFNMSFNQFF